MRAIATGTVRCSFDEREGEREEELVPGQDEGKKPGRGERRRHHRQEHARQDAPGLDAPSMIAASSSSRGNSRMKAVSTQAVKGSVRIR